MKKVWFIVAGVLTAIIVAISVAVAATKNPQPIRVGVILPLTGDGATLGEDCLRRIQLAADKFNQTSGLTVRLSVEDSQGKPDAAVNAFNKLRVSGLRLVIGDLFSSPTLAIAPIAAKYKILLFSPGASNPKLSGFSKYVLRNYPSDNYEGKLIATYVIDQSYMSAAVIYPNNDYGVGVLVQRKPEFWPAILSWMPGALATNC